MPAAAPIVRLRHVDPSDDVDVDAVVAFVNRHYASELPLEREGIKHGHYVFFWAVVDDATASDGEVVVGATAYVPKTPYLAESVKTVVDPGRRRGGMGAAISQAIEDEVRRRGFKKIMSTILIHNVPMIVIKLRQGYLVEGIHMDHEKPGLHEYSLGKVFR
jgi:GNAT superfamily N-acetyltransferase